MNDNLANNLAVVVSGSTINTVRIHIKKYRFFHIYHDTHFLTGVLCG